jgi:hypothetical protein
MTVESDAVDDLQRWTDAGALWRVVRRSPGLVELSLCTCTGGEEVDRIVSTDPDVLRYIGERWASDD